MVTQYSSPQLPNLAFFTPPESRSHARFFGTGQVRLALLSLLDPTPKHGYALMKDLRDRLGDLYQSSAGTVYPTLKQLEKDGLIESRLKDRRNLYRLTKAGRKLVVAEASAITQIWSRASDFHGLGEFSGPHAAVVSSPLQEVVQAALLASLEASGNPDREDQIRSILRNAAAQLRTLTQEKAASRAEKK